MNKIQFLLNFFLIISCVQNNENDNNIHSKTDKIETLKSMIVGKPLKSIEKIICDSIDLKNTFIFIYNGYDCEDCIDYGFNQVKKIDSLFHQQIVYVVATTTNTGRDQYRNNYYNFIYFDEHDLVRRELKYIYTPVIIKLDSLKNIEDAFFPGLNKNFNEEILFVNKFISR